MESEARQPCPRCGEWTPLIARVCSHCQGSLLVDLLVEEPLDARTAYSLARELQGRFPDLPFLEAKRGLEQPEAPLLSGVTRQETLGLALVLAELGVATRYAFRPSESESGRKGSGPHGMATFAAIAAVLVVAAGLAFVMLRSPDSATGDDPGALGLISETVGETVISTRQVTDQVLPSTVTLRCPSSVGAGFFVAEDLVATNAHVLCEHGQELTVELADGRKLTGLPDHRDVRLDLALVRVDGAGVKPIPLGDATTMRQGDPALVIGNPAGLDFTVTQAIISHHARNVMGVVYLQVDANINPGNSGGPLLDAQGRAVGVVSMTVGESTGLGLALPVNYLYEDKSLLPRPSHVVDRGPWRSLLQRAAAEDQEQVEDLAAVFSQPGLGAALLSPRLEVVAVVVRQSTDVPDAEIFDFELTRSGQESCFAFGEVRTWYEIEQPSASLPQDSRAMQWLEKNDLLAGMYAGQAQLVLEDCGSPRSYLGGEMILAGADPRMEAATLETLQ